MATAIAHMESGLPLTGMRLDNCRAAWRIASGTADVFALDAEWGSRRFLFRLVAGERLVAEPARHGAQVIARVSSDAVLGLQADSVRDGELSSWTKRIAVAAGLDHTDYETTLVGLLCWLRDREAAEGLRIQSKLASAEADLDAALALLSNPIAANAPACVRASSNTLFRVCDVVARAAGIALVRPDLSARDGLTIEGIARASGVQARRAALSEGWWRRDAGPFVAYRQGKPLALLPCGPGRCRLWDPASDHSRIVDARLAAKLEPVAYEFVASLPAGPISVPRLAWFAARESRADLLRVVAYSAAACFVGLVPPILMRWFAESVLPGGDAVQLVTVAAALIASSVCAALFSLGATFSLQRAGARAGARSIAAIWDRLLSLPAGFFRLFDPADLSMRVVGLERVRESLTGALGSGAVASFFSIVHLILIARFAPSLFVPAIGILALIAAASAIGGCLILRSQSAIAECEARASRTAMETIQGVAKLRVAGAEARAFAAWARDFGAGRAASIRARGISGAVAALHAATPLSGWILIAAVALGDSSVRSRPAYLLAFAVSFQKLLAAALQLSEVAFTAARSSVLLGRLRPVLDALPESRAGSADPGVLSGSIELRSVTFRYASGGRPVFNGVSLQVEPGEFVAIVGSSGCGKSTLLRLLLGFCSPESGSVLFDGRDLATLDMRAVRRQLGVVLQGGRILAGDLRSNILGATGLPMEAAWKAAESAGIASEIRAMPMGMHTQLSEGGAELSGGQRQRILIARALVHTPRILLFDEATSALDNRTQAAVTSAIEQLGATRIVVAHRLSTIRSADRIVVLERGDISEVGTYDELVARRGRFWELVRRQNT